MNPGKLSNFYCNKRKVFNSWALSAFQTQMCFQVFFMYFSGGKICYSSLVSDRYFSETTKKSTINSCRDKSLSLLGSNNTLLLKLKTVQFYYWMNEWWGDLHSTDNFYWHFSSTQGTNVNYAFIILLSETKEEITIIAAFFLSIMIGQLTLKSFHDFAFVSANETQKKQK